MEAVRCDCGEPLVDELDENTVTVGGEAYRFRRDTDFVACPNCGRLHRVSDLRHPLELAALREAIVALEQISAELAEELGVFDEDLEERLPPRVDGSPGANGSPTA